MDTDWAADVKKFVPDADDGVISAIVKYCGIALRNRDSSLVSMSDPVETGRVRDNFLKKKLGLTHADGELDMAIAAVGERMKGVNFKNRVTVYYLLLEHFDHFHVFGGKPAGAGAGAAAVAGAAALGGAALAGAADTAASGASDRVQALKSAGASAADATGAAASGVAGTAAAAGGAVLGAAGAAAAGAGSALSGGAEALTGDYGDERKGGLGWLWWLLLALLALFLIWWLFFRHPNPVDAGAGAASTEAAASTASEGAGTSASGAAGAPSALDAAPAEGQATIPQGEGVTVEMRDGKPVAKVYFATGKTTVAPAFGATATALKGYLDSHQGATLAVSGYNDPTGNAAANAALSKHRAQAVKAALVAAGLPDAAVALVKPEQTTDTSSDQAGARRVEVVVK